MKRSSKNEFLYLPKSDRVKVALSIVDDDLADGAWLAMMSDITGLDVDEVCVELSKQCPPSAKTKSDIHSQTPVEDKIPCSVCNRKLKGKNALSQHMRDKHQLTGEV